MTPKRRPTKANMQLWSAVALCYGYNELAKKAETLGEKVFCRIARDSAEAEIKRLGGQIQINEDQPTILVLSERMPHIRFYERDIELMREAVRQHDARVAAMTRKRPKAPPRRVWLVPYGPGCWMAFDLLGNRDTAIGPYVLAPKPRKRGRTAK